jgi:5-hydroxyisourate hydrolase
MSLSTHVLDTATGRPAAGVGIELARLSEGGARAVLRTAETNADGRTDAPLLAAGQLEAGAYELVFAVGAYFAPEPSFYEDVTVRFVVHEPDQHHHVPLLVSPWAYSTYRGS